MPMPRRRCNSDWSHHHTSRTSVQDGLQNRPRSGQHGGDVPFFVGGMVSKEARLACNQKDPAQYRVPPFFAFDSIRFGGGTADSPPCHGGDSGGSTRPERQSECSLETQALASGARSRWCESSHSDHFDSFEHCSNAFSPRSSTKEPASSKRQGASENLAGETIPAWPTSKAAPC